MGRSWRARGTSFASAREDGMRMFRRSGCRFAGENMRQSVDLTRLLITRVIRCERKAR
jgi:hypothetical protein